MMRAASCFIIENYIRGSSFRTYDVNEKGFLGDFWLLKLARYKSIALVQQLDTNIRSPSHSYILGYVKRERREPGTVTFAKTNCPSADGISKSPSSSSSLFLSLPSLSSG